MIAAYLNVWKKGFIIEGRANRKECWSFLLGNILLDFVLILLSMVVPVLVVLHMILVIAAIVPSLTLSIRRLHDLDKSGWWMLLVLVPITNFVLCIFLFFIRGTTGDNRFGSPSSV